MRSDHKNSLFLHVEIISAHGDGLTCVWLRRVFTEIVRNKQCSEKRRIEHGIADTAIRMSALQWFGCINGKPESD